MKPIRDSLAEYVAARRVLGTQLREPAVTLSHFVDFLESQGAEFVTTKLALDWAQKPDRAQRSTWARRLSMVRRFATWVSASDSRTEIPPRGLIEARHRRNNPYIYSEQEIEKLMAQAAHLPSQTGLRALNLATLIGLLASTGLRPGEAMALERNDADLQTGVLTIRQTKFGKSRLVPIQNSTLDALAHYAKQRDQICQRPQAKTFFLSERGMRLEQGSVRRQFAKISRAIGLREPQLKRRIGRGPRLQDLRHTFATRRLVEWYRAGVDVGRRMPALATYLGHITVNNTYWYIEAVPELLALAAEHRLTAVQGGAR